MASKSNNRPNIFLLHYIYIYFWKIQVVEYQIGDVLEVLPGQNPAVVDAFIKRCKLDPDSYITVCYAIPFVSNLSTYILISILSLLI
jgi:sulfite reductase alpha subunit-like flavoprotein